MKIKVQKRNGDIVDFRKDKITNAINKAIKDVYPDTVEKEYSTLIADGIEQTLELDHMTKTDIPNNVEMIQDMVELMLMSHDPFVAKAYILYRNQRKNKRSQGWQMSELERDIYEGKYRQGNETFDGFITRVSGSNEKVAKLMRDKRFIPAGRILAGRGMFKKGEKRTLSNCFVLPGPEDSIEDIFDTAKRMARTFSYGGGVGIDISKLRPRGAKVKNAAETTSGAVSFMDLYSLTTGLIGQSSRRGALMISIKDTHPDLQEFIKVKTDLNKVTKANVSIQMSDKFFETVIKDEDWVMTFDVEGGQEKIEKTAKAIDLFNLISEINWDYGEPGMLFWDRIKNWHLLSNHPKFKLETVNP